MVADEGRNNMKPVQFKNEELNRKKAGRIRTGSTIHTRSLGPCVVREEKYILTLRQRAYLVDRPGSYSQKPVWIFESEILPVGMTS
jgi:hypothetical protein